MGQGTKYERPFRITLQGHKRVAKKLKTIAIKYPVFAARALNEEAELTMTLAKQWTPVKSGTLKRSGKVQKPATPKTLWARLTYGTKYALYVHEIPPPKVLVGKSSPKKAKGKKGKRRAYHKPPTRYKFLEGAVNARASGFTRRIAKSIKEDLKQLGASG
jgi:hypothetical protein